MNKKLKLQESISETSWETIGWFDDYKSLSEFMLSILNENEAVGSFYRIVEA